MKYASIHLLRQTQRAFQSPPLHHFQADIMLLGSVKLPGEALMQKS